MFQNASLDVSIIDADYHVHFLEQGLSATTQEFSFTLLSRDGRMTFGLGTYCLPRMKKSRYFKKYISCR